VKFSERHEHCKEALGRLTSERDEARADLADRDAQHARVIADAHPKDEMHCACVGDLRLEIERLRAELATAHAERDGAVSLATQAERELATLKVRFEQASHRAGEAASVVDLANSWARELGVQEAANPCGLRNLIDSLWVKTSQRMHDRACALARIRSEETADALLMAFGDISEYVGRGLTWIGGEREENGVAWVRLDIADARARVLAVLGGKP